MTELSIQELEKELNERQAAAERARNALAKAKQAETEARMLPLRALTERAHKCLCQWNHTDGCSWGYEESAPDPWRCDAHNRWLGHYDRLINGSPSYPPKATIADVEEILSAVEHLKPKVKTALSLLRGGLQP